jgi:hypothetical protein
MQSCFYATIGRFASPIPSRRIVSCPVIPRKTFQILHTKLARAGVSHLKASPLQRHQTVTQGIPRARPRLLTPDRFFAPKNCPPSQIEFWRGTRAKLGKVDEALADLSILVDGGYWRRRSDMLDGPEFAALHSDDRFKALGAKLGQLTGT